MLFALPASVTPWIATLAWSFAGFGMGLAISGTSVLLLELSPTADQGANSAALQMSDALGSVLMLGVGGLLFGVLHDAVGAVGTFAPIYVVMALLAVAGIALAGRLRPDTAD